MSQWFSPSAHVGKLRNYLLAWTLGPIALFMAMGTVSLYQSTLQATAAAHDRLLRATAQQMGDLLRVERNSLTIHVPLALILVGETLEARQLTASTLLWAMLARQLLLMGVIVVITWLVANRALRPLHALSDELKQRSAEDTSMLASRGPEELQPVIDEMNQLLARQHELLQQQRRFVADASHQLRTPLTVLKTQLQSALSGDAPSQLVLPEMLRTVDRTTHLANQLLNQARLEQMRQPSDQQTVRMGELAQAVVLEMSPLIAAKHLAFSLEAAVPALVQGKAWMAGELVRNLLANAIRHSPVGGTLGIRFTSLPGRTEMVVWDCGPGIDEAMRAWLFQPFAAVKGVAGAGLGLAICLDIATSMNARIDLVNRLATDGSVLGLDAVVAWEHGASPT